MAAQDYYGVVQQLYISYFGRPADYFGLRNFADQLEAMDAPTDYEELAAAVEAGNNAGLTALVQSFNTSEESIALYGNDNSQLGMSRFVAAIYQNVLGREADAEGFAFWTNALATGQVTKANAAASITAAALKLEGEDAQTVQNKLAVATAFTDSLDTPSKFNAYAGEDAAAAARGLLQGVNADTNVDSYQTVIDTTIDSIVNVSVPGQNFVLTANIDNFIGTAGNDTFAATITKDAAGNVSNPIGALDIIDGGAGRDTLSIADTSTAAADSFSLSNMTIRNIENMNLSTSGSLNADISNTGVTSATLAAAGTGASTVTAAGTTDVNVTVAAGVNATVNGGKAVVVNTSATTAATPVVGVATVTGAALTGVTVTGGRAVIDNTSAANAAGAGSTLTSVSLDNVSGANTITGRGVTTVNLSNIDATGTTVGVTNSSTATTKPLTVNVNGVENVTLTATGATSVAVNAAADSQIAVVAAAATAATVTGSGDLELNLTGSNALTSLDTSAATGDVALTGLNSTIVTVKGGAGAESFTTTQTAKVSFDLGAGNDIVTIGSVIAAGSTINLGAGNDKLVKGAGGSIVANTTTAATVIDGGEGVDTLAAGLLNAGNAAQFKNFEILGLDNSQLDVSLVTGTTFTGLELLAGNGTYTNVTNAQGLAVNTAGVTGTTTLTFNNVTGAADAYTVTFGSDTTGTAASPTAISAGTVSLAGIEAINIASGSAAGVAANSIVLADANAQTVTVTGSQALNLAFATGFGGTITAGVNSNKGVSTIDGSAATGKLTINTANVAAATEGGLTVKGGSAADTITLVGAATVQAGAGDDVITVGGSFASTLTGGAGKDTFNVKLATGTAGMATITDFVAADDKIVFTDGGTFKATAVDVSTATTLELALNAAAAGTTGNDITWFQYGGNTYVVDDTSTATTFGAGDIVVKLTGLIDLSTAGSSIVSAAAVAPAPAPGA